jgi:hypothetical protein
MALNLVHRVITNPAEGQTTTPVTFVAATNLMIYTPVRPIRVVRWGVILTTAPTGTGPLQFVGNTATLPQGGGTVVTGASTLIQATGYNASNSPQFFVDTAGGSLTLPAASFGSVVAGSMLWHTVNAQTAQAGGYYPAPDTALIPPGGVDTQLVIYPGQSFIIRSVTVGGTTAGAGVIWLEEEELAFQADFSNNPMVLSGIPGGFGLTGSITPTPSLPFPYAPFNGQS